MSGWRLGKISQKAHPGRTSSCTRPRGRRVGGRGGSRARAEARRRTRPGAAVMVWVERWHGVLGVADNLVPTHTDGADRNDNKYIDNGPTFHQVNANTFDRCGIRRQLSDVTGPPPSAGGGVADPGQGAARARTAFRWSGSMPTTGSTQGRALLRRLPACDPGKAVGRVTAPLRSAAPSSGQAADQARARLAGSGSSASCSAW